MDAQTIEVLGRHRLTEELLEEDIEVALPVRDRGVDLVAYLEQGEEITRFCARPIQMKAAREAVFSIEKKYAKVPHLLLVFVWFVTEPAKTRFFALTYDEAVRVAEMMGYTDTASWQQGGKYAVTSVGSGLEDELKRHETTGNGERWRRILDTTGC